MRILQLIPAEVQRVMRKQCKFELLQQDLVQLMFWTTLMTENVIANAGKGNQLVKDQPHNVVRACLRLVLSLTSDQFTVKEVDPQIEVYVLETLGFNFMRILDHDPITHILFQHPPKQHPRVLRIMTEELVRGIDAWEEHVLSKIAARSSSDFHPTKSAVS